MGIVSIHKIQRMKKNKRVIRKRERWDILLKYANVIRLILDLLKGLFDNY
jgi:hypothetical protein